MNIQRGIILMLLAFSALLSACAGNRPAERAAYDLHGIDPTPGERAPAMPLRLDLRMAAWFDTSEIAYRLNYDAPTRLRQYADSRWAAKAGLLAGERLQGLFGPVALNARCTVRVEITEFAQHFERPDQSRFVLDARWSVSNANGERLLAAARSFAVEAPSADARGGVHAAAKATAQLGVALLAGAHTLADCK